jgi:hypothetical protein
MEGPPRKRNTIEEVPRITGGWRDMLALVLAGTIGMAVAEQSVVEHNSSPDYEADWSGIREKTPFDLQALESIARAKLEIPGKSYVFHIAQMHGASSLDFTKKYYADNNIPLERLVECQKQIERTILFLKDNYGVTKVFMEGLIPEDAAYYEKQMQQVAADPTSAGHALTADAATIPGATVPGFFDEYRARDLMVASEALRDTPEGAVVANDPLIAGDLRYVWGGGYNLAAKGDIHLLAAEDSLANGAATLKGLTSAEGHTIREKAAVDMIASAATDEAPTALVYGAAHDFIETFSAKNMAVGTDIGLIRIDPLACKK